MVREGLEREVVFDLAFGGLIFKQGMKPHG